MSFWKKLFGGSSSAPDRKPAAPAKTSEEPALDSALEAAGYKRTMKRPTDHESIVDSVVQTMLVEIKGLPSPATQARSSATTSTPACANKVASNATESKVEPAEAAIAVERLFAKACEKGDLEKVNELIVDGVDINADDGRPFYLASGQGHKAIVELLIAKGADVNRKCGIGRAPLHNASAQGRDKMVEFLIAHGADINVRDKYGETPLHEALELGSECVAEILINKGANVSIATNRGATPLHLALQKGCKKIAKLLITSGADVNAADKNGETPLRLALLRGYKELAELLIANGANINATDKDGVTVINSISLAVTKGFLQITNLPDGLELNINPVDKYGRTSLHLALSEGHIEVAEQLISKGGSVQSADRNGITPALVAELANRCETMSFDQLAEQLVALSQEGYNWGKNNGFPEIEAYPQFLYIRRIGAILHNKFGNSGMQQACSILKQRVRVREGGGHYLAEYSWGGISGWHP